MLNFIQLFTKTVTTIKSIHKNSAENKFRSTLKIISRFVKRKYSNKILWNSRGSSKYILIFLMENWIRKDWTQIKLFMISI